MLTLLRATIIIVSCSSISAAGASDKAIVKHDQISTRTPETNKRGAAYNDPAYANLFGEFGSQVTWGYDWSQSNNGLGGSWPAVEYVPMLWGLDSGITSTWASNVAAAISAGSSHLLSFNEPDLSTESNLTPAQAAAGYLEYMQPFSSVASLGGPAITAGGLPWLVEFYGNCTGCTIDFQPIHWYDTATNYYWFKTHLEQVWAATNMSTGAIWITEFAGSGTSAEQITFLETVMPWLDTTDWIQRYAYFGVFNGSLVDVSSSGAAVQSQLGQVFDVYYNTTVSVTMTSIP